MVLYEPLTIGKLVIPFETLTVSPYGSRDSEVSGDAIQAVGSRICKDPSRLLAAKAALSAVVSVAQVDPRDYDIIVYGSANLNGWMQSAKGPIFVTDRLIEFSKKVPGAMEFVVAHEIAHSLGRHLTCRSALNGKIFLAQLDSEEARQTRWSALSIMEERADEYAASVLLKLGFEISPGLEVLKILAESDHVDELANESLENTGGQLRAFILKRRLAKYSTYLTR